MCNRTVQEQIHQIADDIHHDVMIPKKFFNEYVMMGIRVIKHIRKLVGKWHMLSNVNAKSNKIIPFFFVYTVND